MLGQKLFAYARLVIETMQRCLGRDLYEITVAFFVFGEHQQMVVSVAFGRRAPDVMVIFLADVKLAADDRLDTGLDGGIHKMHGAKNIAVVGHGHGRHSQLLDALDELFDVAGAIEHGVIAMQMQVDEFRHEDSDRSPEIAGSGLPDLLPSF